jgi:hypothetical protein
MSDIFISYKRDEQAMARKLANALESEGWTVWWDPKLRAGEHFDDVIERSLNEAKCVIVMWSKLSVKSEYVKAEATEALEQRKLVSIKIESVNLPFRFKRVHTPSLLNWDGSKDDSDFRKLVDDIAQIVGQPAAKAKGKAQGQRTAKNELLRKQERQSSAEDATPKADEALEKLLTFRERTILDSAVGFSDKIDDRSTIQLAGSEQANLRIVKQSIMIDLSNDGMHSIIIKEFLRHISGRPSAKSKHFNGVMNFIDGSFDKDFAVAVELLPIHPRVTTYPRTHVQLYADQKNSVVVTFSEALSDENPELEYGFRYRMRGISCCSNFLEKQNENWVFNYSEPVDELCFQLLLPLDLPRNKWTQGNFRVAMNPQNWGTASNDTYNARKRITIDAQNLKPATRYSVSIDGRVTP